MTQKTIMLTNLPAVLRDFLERVLSGQAEVTLVRAPVQGDLIAAAATAKADIVVAASPDPAALAAIDPTLAWVANLSILALTPDGRSACIHRVRSETRVLNDLTPQEIVALLITPSDAKPRHRG